MKSLMVDWHTKDNSKCGTFNLTYEKRKPNEKAIKKRILRANPHITQPIEIRIME